MAVVASHDYLTRHGEPETPEDLARHNRIGFNFARSFEGWPFRRDGVVMTIPAAGNVQVGDGESARRLALAGVGFARLAHFHIGPDIAAGRLRVVLEAFNPGDLDDIHAVFIGQGGHLPARIRAFIDFLAERARVT